MREKSGLILLLLLVFNVFSFVSALDTSGIQSASDKITGTADQIQGVQKVLTQDESRKEYLKQQWGGLIRNPNSSVGKFFAPVVNGYGKVSPYSDPTIQFLVGMTPQLSLFFVLVLVIWCTLVRYYYIFYQALKEFSVFSSSTNIIIVLVLFVVLTVTQFFQSISFFVANKIVDIIGLATSKNMQILYWVIAAAIFILFAIFSRKIVAGLRLYNIKKIKAERERKDDENRELLGKELAAMAKANDDRVAAAMKRAERNREDSDI